MESALLIVLGYLLAIVVEPLKHKILESKKIKDLRTSMYRDILRIYGHYMTTIRLIEDGISSEEDLRAMLQSQRYPYSYRFAKAQPLLYYQLKEASAFDTIYDFFFRLKRFSKDMPAKRLLHTTKQFLSIIEFMIEAGDLSNEEIGKLTDATPNLFDPDLTGPSGKFLKGKRLPKTKSTPS